MIRINFDRFFQAALSRDAAAFQGRKVAL